MISNDREDVDGEVVERSGQQRINSSILTQFKMTHSRPSEIGGVRNCYTSSQLHTGPVDSQR